MRTLLAYLVTHDRSAARTFVEASEEQRERFLQEHEGPNG